MCRMILAIGEFDAHAVIDAAATMAKGEEATHEKPVPCHPNGWGAVSAHAGSAAIYDIERGVRPFWVDKVDYKRKIGAPVVLAIHTRHATISTKLGVEYSHPVSSDAPDPMLIMHNGFTPYIYKELGLNSSSFDTREYLQWIVENRHVDSTGFEQSAAMDNLRPGSSSGNAFYFACTGVQAFVWYPEDSTLKDYFTMHMLMDEKAIIVASEPCSSLAERSRWQPLSRGARISVDPFKQPVEYIDRSY